MSRPASMSCWHSSRSWSRSSPRRASSTRHTELPRSGRPGRAGSSPSSAAGWKASRPVPGVGRLGAATRVFPTLRALSSTSPRAAELIARLEALAATASRHASAMDFSFLYDRQRALFSIGYQLTSHALDPSYYDLLASEARLASYVAIAKDDVPVDHWFHLGRELSRAAGETALMSWSGTMFEYLMPLLLMRSFPETLLDQTYRGAVRRQIAHGTRHAVPWGTSESAYNVRDRFGTYQYRAFGVPDLALKRGLDTDLVIAPYASALAAMVEPARALGNMRALERRGALGPYGFRDALDYTRPDPGKACAVVENFMAHHLGMGLGALTNALTGQILAAPLPCRPAGACRGAVALRAHPAPADAPGASERSTRGRAAQPRARGPGGQRARHPVHPAAPGGAAGAAPLHGHAHQRRLRVQPLRGPRRHPLAGRWHRRFERAALLREGRDARAPLVHRSPAGLRPRRHLPRLDGHRSARLPPDRWADRDPDRDHHRPRRLGRGAAGDRHQQRQRSLRDRAHQLRRAGPRTARRRPHPPRLREPLRGDRLAFLVLGDHRHPAPPLGLRTAGVVRPRGGDRRGACGSGHLRDRPESLPRTRPIHPSARGAR